MDNKFKFMGHYVLYFAATGIYFPFLPLFLANIPLNSVQIGFLLSIGPLTSIFAQAFWGSIADHYNRKKESLLLTLTFTAIISLLLPLGKGLAVLAIILFLYNLTNSAVTPLSDSLVLSTLKDSRDYGKIRLWGSLGFALTAGIGGVVFTFIPLALFGTIIGLILLATLFWARALPNPRNNHKHYILKQSPLLTVLKTPGLLNFFVVTLLVMVPYNAYTAFFGWHMQLLGATRYGIGIGWLIAAMSEIPVFGLGRMWLKKFNPKQLILMAAVVFALRWFAYAGISDYRFIDFLQISQSLSFALFYLAGVEYLNILVPTHLQGSTQSLFNAVSFGVSAIIGTNGAGMILQQANVHSLYIVLGLSNILAIIFIWGVLGKPTRFVHN